MKVCHCADVASWWEQFIPVTAPFHDSCKMWDGIRYDYNLKNAKIIIVLLSGILPALHFALFDTVFDGFVWSNVYRPMLKCYILRLRQVSGEETLTERRLEMIWMISAARISWYSPTEEWRNKSLVLNFGHSFFFKKLFDLHNRQHMEWSVWPVACTRPGRCILIGCSSYLKW